MAPLKSSETQIRKSKSLGQRDKGDGQHPKCDAEITRLAAKLEKELEDHGITMPASCFVPGIKACLDLLKGDSDSLEKVFPVNLFATLCAEYGPEHAQVLLELRFFSRHFDDYYGMADALHILETHEYWEDGGEPSYWAKRKSDHFRKWPSSDWAPLLDSPVLY